MSNDRKIGMFFLIFILFFGASFYFASKNGLRGPVEKDEEKEVKTYAVQSHEYYDDLTCFKYVITSKDELDIFKSKFNGDLVLDDVDFDNNKVFIQLEVESSGSIQKEIADFMIDKNIIFVIKTKTPDVGTDDMALWYYIAIVPNNKLAETNYSAWQKPSEVLNNNDDLDIINEE